MAPAPRTLVFYATSPSHLRALDRLREALDGWRFVVLEPVSLRQIAPGIETAAKAHGFECIALESPDDVDRLGSLLRTVIGFGAVFEPFALKLFVWAKERAMPVVAFEEVAQLALNDCRINNYDAPFDRLFLASPAERDLFLELGYPSSMLQVSGLLSRDRTDSRSPRDSRHRPNAGHRSTILYTTSPLVGRRAIQNLDDAHLREEILKRIRKAARGMTARIIVKLHPNEDLVVERKRVRRIIPSALVIGRERPIETLFDEADVVVNRGNSQTALDAALRGIPTVIAALGIKTIFHSSGGAWIADRLEDIPGCIRQAMSEPGPDAATLRNVHDWSPSEGTAALIARELGAIAARRGVSNDTQWRWCLKSMLFMGISEAAMDLAKRRRSGSRWMTLAFEAIELHFAGEQELSAHRWQELAELDPTWFFPWHELAYKALAAGNYPAAIESAKQAIILHPPFHRLWHEIPMRVILADALREQGRTRAAEAELTRLDVLGIGDLMPDVLLARSRLVSREGQCLNALRIILRAFHMLRQTPAGSVEDAKVRENVERCLHSLNACQPRRGGRLVRIATRLCRFAGRAWIKIAQ
jgi:hypothetical protein